MKEHSDGDEALDLARRRTLGAASARILVSRELTFEMPAMPQRRRGGLLRPLTRLGKAAGKRLWRRAVGDFDFRRQEAEGVIDLARRRYMIDYGHYARLFADGQEWDGRSGRPLSTLPPETDVLPTPLWLLDLLVGITETRDAGTEEVQGTPCRRIAAKTDLSRASRETPGGIAVPELGRFEDLLSLPIEVWVDESHVRRIRFERKDQVDTVELWDFDTPLDGLDWTRLPTFRSPEEAESLTAEQGP
jgi:hypothetical protein